MTKNEQPKQFFEILYSILKEPNISTFMKAKQTVFFLLFLPEFSEILKEMCRGTGSSEIATLKKNSCTVRLGSLLMVCNYSIEELSQRWCFDQFNMTTRVTLNILFPILLWIQFHTAIFSCKLSEPLDRIFKIPLAMNLTEPQDIR